MICFEGNGRLGLGLTENFCKVRDFHLISEVVLADNHLPTQVPTEVFSIIVISFAKDVKSKMAITQAVALEQGKIK